MLPFDFDYYKPATLKEAVDLHQYLNQHGKLPMFFSGGTELITLGRIDLAYTEAVIDIKDILECNVMQVSGDHLLLGSTLSLTKIEEANLFPLLTKTASQVADHTARGKISLGGNICARIFYREAVLPFLLSDSQVLIVGPEGKKMVPINEIFLEKLQLKKGEFLVQLATETRFIKAPFFSFKRRQQWDTGYPLITVAALKIGQEVRVAISGFCPFPFRSKELEASLNKRNLPVVSRIDEGVSKLPKPILDDVEGSAKYRLFVLRNLLMDVLAVLDGT
ncbi:FAD binding domain-containing protein [Bacillus sp. ISL-40]|uniref:FAD binding domain-containing protein n=1 Tax=unclassified Bacillus (in: firmicutes) TaxID=185979 RepID=UPI001BE99992|nr:MULTISPECIES: FAD binding domain-containing protein [unclassified Bacillus (in: firmicutes)]MBT2696692.1 FAD binding domain-containing protein [Bacillus sp. ISL-40]MBT2721305.1 FAD binding domain-containing protein [Bacillus sp. ISL-46]MBT2740009.1 FAD binding domain-containing protein [Bacillus sp. ISL-77]